MNGHCYNILSIFTSKFLTEINSRICNNIDYVFIFNIPSKLERKKFYEEYINMSSFEHFL